MLSIAISSLLLLQAPGAITKPLEAPFRVMDHALVVDAVVNGKKISFMFDTGFSGHFVVSERLNIGPESGRINLRDFVGTFSAPTVKIDSIQLGELKQTEVDGQAVQMSMGNLSLSYGVHTDGIMGLSVVKDYVTEINFEQKKFIFHPQSTDITKRTPDNKRTFLVKMEPTGFQSIHLPSDVSGKPVHLSLDTGNAFYLTTHKEVLERVGLWDPDDKPQFVSLSGVASGTVDSFDMYVPEANLYGVPIEGTTWNVIDLPSSTSTDDGTVGFGFLKHFNIIIDMDRRYVWLENWTGEYRDEQLASAGFRVSRLEESGNYFIFGIARGGPADTAGIERGDLLRAIGGKTVSQLSESEVERRIEGPEGSTVDVAVSRDGTLMRFKLPRQILVNGWPGG